MRLGVQFTGNIPAGSSQRWFTFNWNAANQVVWTVVPTSPRPGAAQVEWTVEVERANPSAITYWITIRNLTNTPVNIEARYAVLN